MRKAYKINNLFALQRFPGRPQQAKFKSLFYKYYKISTMIFLKIINPNKNPRLKVYDRDHQFHRTVSNRQIRMYKWSEKMCQSGGKGFMAGLYVTESQTVGDK